MAYQKYVSDKPVIADDGDIVINNTRENLMALRDAIVAGALVDWNISGMSGPADQPTEMIYKKSSEWIRLAITWGTTGGEDNNPKTIVYSYDGDAGASYDTIGTWTGTYDANGNLTAEAWT
jgi:hypothetical protein